MSTRSPAIAKLVWIAVFGIAFGFVEASVVVYLRGLYYPGGFTFPLKRMSDMHLVVELLREASTIVMLGAAAILAGSRLWERFGYFLVAFGLWDLFYYIWLKAMLDWPSSLTEWDILFLLPVPWIGPVIAPAVIALAMTAAGIFLVLRLARGGYFRPMLLSWICAASATAIILYSFTADVAATLGRQLPSPYRYSLLVAGIVLYGVGLITASRQHASAR